MTNPKIINEFSAPIINYILNEIPPYVGLVVLQADEEGLLKKWYGPVGKYFQQNPTKEVVLEEFAPMLHGMIPPIVNPMLISHVRINENTYVDIHLLHDEQGQTWIFLVDQTRQVEIIHPIIQRFNEEKLGIINDHKQSSARGTLSALYLLDYMSFERVGETYRLLGDSPVWFGEIKSNIRNKGKNVDLTELFPYMEVFQIEAAEIWASRFDGKIVSGLWEEEKVSGGTLYLQALALRHDKRNYLLVKPLHQQSDLNDGFIQTAREQHLTLNQLANTEKKLKELLNFKDQFVSIISHDLRSPIGAVIGLTDLLLTDENLLEKLDQSQSELLSDIKNEMLRLLDYNDKLYQWSNLELGNFKVSRKTIHPKHLARYVEKMQSGRMKEKNIRFISHIATGFTFEADETLLGQALNNLVGNSVKFTPEGGSIQLNFVENLGSKSIVVGDSGQGMDQETCERLFSGFTRKTTMGTYGEKGTGLGLGIVKKIIDAHGFTIHVESVPGTGTTFTIGLSE
jgi:signal transduction histidine kinase